MEADVDRRRVVTTHMRTKTGFSALLVALTTVLAALPARAESPYTLDNPREYAWIGTGLSLLVGGYIATGHVDPLTSDEIAALDRNNINALDRRTMQSYREDHAGDGLAVASFVLPLTFLARDDMREDAETLAVMWAEAAAWTEGLVMVTKTIATRARPYAYDVGAPDELKTQRDARLSFYSGHVTSAAMNGFFMAKVFSDYSSNRNAEVAMWTGAVLYPALTGYFRVDSGHHFTTDAITGLVVGAAVGYLVPALHRRDDNDLSVGPALDRGGVTFTATFAF